MASTNRAYDFELFEQKKEPQIRALPEKKPVNKPKPKAKPVRAVFACTLTLIAIFFVLYNRALLTEVNDDIYQTENAIEQIQNENDTLRIKLESLVSMENIEEYATQELGFTKINANQMQYITLSTDDKIEATPEQKGAWTSFFDSIGEFFSGLLEYLNLG